MFVVGGLLLEIKNIVEAINKSQVLVSRHAREEAIADNLLIEEICFSVIQGEIIEDYTDDKPYPSCLIFGRNKKYNPIHSVWAYNQDTGWAILITVYRPKSSKWIEWSIRRK